MWFSCTAQCRTRRIYNW